MSRIFASVASAALVAALAVPAFAADAKSSFGNIEAPASTLFKPDAAKSALTVPTERKTITYASGTALFSTSITEASGSKSSLDLASKVPASNGSFAAGEAAKSILIQSK